VASGVALVGDVNFPVYFRPRGVYHFLVLEIFARMLERDLYNNGLHLCFLYTRRDHWDHKARWLYAYRESEDDDA
jgi:hypothetical protein